MPAIGCVSYLNAKPLIDGLECEPACRIHLDVPSRLLRGLLDRSTDIALLPIIDFQTAPENLCIVPCGGIGSDGETLTVRLFSRKPIPEIDHVAVDGDSHTSVALLEVILRDQYGIQPRVSPMTKASPTSDLPRGTDAMLLIGDKVVNSAPTLPIQLDLGEAWKQLTGLPFVFAAWMTRIGEDLGDLPRVLARQRDANRRCIADVVNRHAPMAGWPRDLAIRYLGSLLSYELGHKELKAIGLFWDRCRALGMISRLRPLALYGQEVRSGK